MSEYNVIYIDDPEVTEDSDGNDIRHLTFTKSHDSRFVYCESTGKHYFNAWDLAGIVGPYDSLLEAMDARRGYLKSLP